MSSRKRGLSPFRISASTLRDVKLFRPIATALLVALAISGTSTARAGTSGDCQGAPEARDVGPAGAPLLWRVDGHAPAYLFGTIHVPDARVLQLSAPVDTALAEAAALYTEIPMDLTTQLALSDRVTLPHDERLQDVIGDALYRRLTNRIQATLSGDQVSEIAATTLLTLLDRLKPWAALAQLALLDYLPDLAAGRQPLDAVLYARARAAGKEVAGLETVDEQVAAFDRFTNAEQIAMLHAALDELDRARRMRTTPARELVDAYLAGNLDRLNELLMDTPSDPKLARKFHDVMLVTRNRRMAERIAAIRRADPSNVQFFAVGALHLAGSEGIPALLCHEGFRVTRVRRDE
ncbi:MAG: hypothetical protein GEU99_15990 [Luteitalea sp.]|nr:hypothetical protein [Luteitalea sp.]